MKLLQLRVEGRMPEDVSSASLDPWLAELNRPGRNLRLSYGGRPVLKRWPFVLHGEATERTIAQVLSALHEADAAIFYVRATHKGEPVLLYGTAGQLLSPFMDETPLVLSMWLTGLQMEQHHLKQRSGR